MSAELIAHRKRLVDEWNAWRARCRREVGEEKEKKKVKGPETEQGQEIEIYVDEVLEQIEEPVDD